MRRANSNLRLMLDIVLIAFVILFPHYVHLPEYAYPFVVLGIIWIYLNLVGESFASIGFRFNDLKWRAFYVGGGIGLLYAVFQLWLLGPFLNHMGLRHAYFRDFGYVRHHFLNALWLILPLALLIIPYQEIVFRGFILNRLKNILSDRGNALSFSGIIASALFAIHNWQGGWGLMVATFIFAVVVTFVCQRYKNNLWYAIFFHITYDVFMVAVAIMT
jgi:membrane protease YdiL (CAAX protease family)